jgi:hypothetical protein
MEKPGLSSCPTMLTSPGLPAPPSQADFSALQIPGSPPPPPMTPQNLVSKGKRGAYPTSLLTNSSQEIWALAPSLQLMSSSFDPQRSSCSLPTYMLLGSLPGRFPAALGMQSRLKPPASFQDPVMLDPIHSQQPSEYSESHETIGVFHIVSEAKVIKSSH